MSSTEGSDHSSFKLFEKKLQLQLFDILPKSPCLVSTSLYHVMGMEVVTIFSNDFKLNENSYCSKNVSHCIFLLMPNHRHWKRRYGAQVEFQ